LISGKKSPNEKVRPDIVQKGCIQPFDFFKNREIGEGWWIRFEIREEQKWVFAADLS